MTKQEQAALKRVTKKLSAMRATLRKDERIWLDRIVLGETEVTGHAATAPSKAMKVTKATAAEVAAHAATAPSKAMKVTKATAAEVAAHAATAPSKAMKVTKATAAEVAAHAATIPQKVQRVTAAQGPQGLVKLDAVTGAYTLNDDAAAI